MPTVLFEIRPDQLWWNCFGMHDPPCVRLSLVRLTASRRNGSARAKSDLQKQIVARGVRKSIASAILSSIGLGSGESESSNRPVSRVERPISVMSSRSHAVELHDNGQFTIPTHESFIATNMKISQNTNREPDRSCQEAITIARHLVPQKPQVDPRPQPRYPILRKPHRRRMVSSPC